MVFLGKHDRRNRLCLVVNLVVLVLHVVTGSSATAAAAAAAALEYQFQVPCPSDPSIDGYTSISALNLEMKRHKSWQSEAQQQHTHTYTYMICPHTRLDGSQQVTPLLDRTYIKCGPSGSSHEECIIDGGTTQVLLVDTLPDTHRIFVFQGITFQNSQGLSIAAVASSRTRAEFLDCHWNDSSGSSVILIAQAHPVTLPLQNPDLSFRFDNVFANRRRTATSSSLLYPNGGDDDGDEVMIEYSPTQSMSVSLSNCTMENSSSVDPHFSAIYNQGALELTNVSFRNLHGLFVVNTIGGTVSAFRTHFFDNSVHGAVLRGMHHATLELDECQFVANNNNNKANNNGGMMMATVASLVGSSVTIRSTLFQNNTSRMEVLLLQDSQGTLANSCSGMVVVDASSAFLQSNTNYYVASILSSSQQWCSSTTTTTNGGHVLVLEPDSSLDCLEEGDGNDCQGSCTTMEATQCALTLRSPFATAALEDHPEMEPSSSSKAITRFGSFQWSWSLWGVVIIRFVF